MTPIVTGIRKRPDLEPVSRGWSTSPNTYRKPTYYEVVGESLGPPAQTVVDTWLAENDKLLTRGRHDLSYGAYTEVEIEYREGAWIVVSYFTYLGG